MINELLYWGVTGLILLVSIWLSHMVLLLAEGTTVDSWKKLCIAILPNAINYFCKFSTLLIAQVLIFSGIAYLNSDSWPNWYFFSKGYYYRTVIIITIAILINKMAVHYIHKMELKIIPKPSIDSTLITFLLLMWTLFIWLFLSERISNFRELRVWYGLFVLLLLAIHEKKLKNSSSTKNYRKF